MKKEIINNTIDPNQIDLGSFKPLEGLSDINMKNYLISGELGLIFDKAQNKFINYYINEYGTVFVFLDNVRFNLPLVIAINFLDNPNNYKYAVRIDKSILDFSIKNIIWVKNYNNSFFKKDLIRLSIDKFGDTFDFSKVDDRLFGKNNKIIVVCKKHKNEYEISIETFLSSSCGGCEYCSVETNIRKIKEELDKLKIENSNLELYDLRILYPDIYNKFVRYSKKSIYEIFYDQTFETLEDYQTFIDKKQIQYSKEFRNKYPGLFRKASDLGILNSIVYPNPQYKLRHLAEMSIENIKKYLLDNKITTSGEFREFDSSLYAITGRRGLLGELGLKKEISYMEIVVPRKLKEVGFYFIEQKTFPWLIYKSNMFLDIYLPEKNAAIELQGSIHFIYSDFYKTEEEFREIQNRDRQKKELCDLNGIKLIYYIDKKSGHYNDIPKDYLENYPLGKVFTDINELINYLINL